MDDETNIVLQDIAELGYVEIRDGRVTTEIKPKINIYSSQLDRWTPTTKYLRDYAKSNHDFGGNFFVCLYDGWREYSEPAIGWERNYIPWKDVDKTNYLGKGGAGEPRFMHKGDDFSQYAELPCKVLTYNRHINDRNALLIPDSQFIRSNCYSDFTSTVSKNDIEWKHKKNKMIWRGSPNMDKGLLYYMGSKHPRQMAVDLSTSTDISKYLDASFAKTSIADQLQYKYILDIDGMVNAWSALYWKLYSNSLVLKTKTHWEQWYYPLLKEYEHYVPISNFYEIPRISKWCHYNDDACKEIAKNATELVNKLTYQYAVEEYKIQ